MAEDSGRNKQPDWVKIVSKRDGHSFIVPRDVAMGSVFLRNTFDPEAGFVEGTRNTCVVDERAIIIEKAMEYLGYKHLYAKAAPRDEIPDFQERIPPDIALELLMAADFLES